MTSYRRCSIFRITYGRSLIQVTRASLKVVAADTDTVSGKKSGRILVDEHWLFGSRSNAASMFMEATGGQISRNEGWVIYLTTQSDEPPAECLKKLDYYRDVRDGKIEDKKSLGVLYEFPPSMIASKAYLDAKNFYITNPNIGRSVSAEWAEDQLKKNRDKKDGSFQQFLAKHLNVEIGLNLRSDRWAGADFWEAQGVCHVSLDELIAQSDVIDVGADGGGLDDLWASAPSSDTRNRANGWRGFEPMRIRPFSSAARTLLARLHDFAADGDLVLVQKVGDGLLRLPKSARRSSSQACSTRSALTLPASAGLLMRSFRQACRRIRWLESHPGMASRRRNQDGRAEAGRRRPSAFWIANDGV